MIRIAAFALAALAAACTPHDPSLVRLPEGAVQGVTEARITRFLSIPYAAAPVGALRWRGPQPPTAWQGVRDATRFGPSCTQNVSAEGWGPWTGEFSPQGDVSEDCLTLSVWTPARRPGERLPVMLWIHGGGFTDGGEATAVYNGQALAERGIVVVTMNYRVAGFGLLTHPALEAEADGARGNYALRDSLAALAWVNANIAQFGGDPTQVTLAGQSAGGALIYAMLDAPQASGRVARAIIQSFPPGSHNFASREAAERDAAAFAQALNANDAAALRSASAADVLRVSGRAHLDLHVDGVTIADPLGASLPLLNNVPILMGITADESSWLPETPAAARTRLSANGSAFAALYPTPTDEAARDMGMLSERHAQMVALQRWGQAHAARSGGPLYLYVWTHTLPGPDAAQYRAFHSAEVPYMFGALDAAPNRGFTDADRAIAAQMLDYWANFVKTGDPNGEGAPAWPNAAESGVFMELGTRFAPLAPLPEAVRAYWTQHYDSTGAYQF